jgi:quinol monooxygenase YgiN
MKATLANCYRVSTKAMSFLALALALCATALAQNGPTGAPDSNGYVFVIVHIDVFPPGTAETVKSLQAFAQHARADKGCIRLEVLQQIGRPNHFTLVEEWANQAAYDADLSSPEAREFREKLQPFLGSPFDERLHTEIK